MKHRAPSTPGPAGRTGSGITMTGSSLVLRHPRLVALNRAALGYVSSSEFLPQQWQNLCVALLTPKPQTRWLHRRARQSPPPAPTTPRYTAQPAGSTPAPDSLRHLHALPKRVPHLLQPHGDISTRVHHLQQVAHRKVVLRLHLHPVPLQAHIGLPVSTQHLAHILTALRG